MPKSKKKYFEIKVNVTSNEWVNMRVAKECILFLNPKLKLPFATRF